MAKRTRSNKSGDERQLEAIVERALSEAGVAEAVEVYERTEAIYAAMSSVSRSTRTYATNSASGVPQTRADHN